MAQPDTPQEAEQPSQRLRATNSSITNSSHSKYTHQGAMQRGNAAWNSGAAIRDLKIEIKYEGVIWARALNVLGLTRSPSVRSWFNGRCA